MTAITTDGLRPTTHYTGATSSSATATRSGWAWAGAAAGVIALVAFMTSGALSPEKAALADNEDVLAHAVDKEALVWVFQVCCSAAALGTAVFAAGLRRRLAAQAPAQSLLPTLAAAGLGSVAIMLLVGGGISTELFWHLMQDAGKSDADTIAANLAIFNTMAWVWAGIGLTAGSVAVAALRHGAFPRWLGWVSVVVTVLVAVTQLVPLQYMAAFAGAPWLIVAGIAMARQERTG